VTVQVFAAIRSLAHKTTPTPNKSTATFELTIKTKFTPQALEMSQSS